MLWDETFIRQRTSAFSDSNPYRLAEKMHRINFIEPRFTEAPQEVVCENLRVW